MGRKLFGTAILASALLLAACGSAENKSTSNSKIEADNHRLYSVKIKKTAEGENHNWILSGTSKAPNGSKIIVTPADSNSLDYGRVTAESTSLASWAKVKDGKFTVLVDPVDLSDGEEKQGQKLEASIFAIRNFDKPWVNAKVSNKVVSTAKKHFKTKTLTINEDQANYYASLDKSSSSSSSSSTSSEDSNKKFEEKINSLNKGTAESATYDANTNTVTWIGFEAWSTYSNNDLQRIMDILQSMTYRQATNYGINVPSVIVELPNGKTIAHASNGNDLKFNN